MITSAGEEEDGIDLLMKRIVPALLLLNQAAIEDVDTRVRPASRSVGRS